MWRHWALRRSSAVAASTFRSPGKNRSVEVPLLDDPLRFRMLSRTFLDLHKTGNKDAIEKERARISDELSQGYFADISEICKNGGKVSPRILQPLFGLQRFIVLSKSQDKLGNRQSMTRRQSSLYRSFASSSGSGCAITRDWISQFWVEENRKASMHRTKAMSHRQNPPAISNAISFHQSIMKSIFGMKTHFEAVPGRVETGNQYSDAELLSGGSPEKVRLGPLLSRANLLITRDIEWANIMFAFEQESRYAIVDPYFPQSPTGFINEQSNIVVRQLLRTRRPFVAYITDGMGNEIFRVRRPFWLINSTIYVEVDGKEVGVVHRRWHLWRRIYDLYLGSKQFAVVENPGFWNWTFTLRDENENVLAQIDRDWRGIGMELFTDAGQYVIRFGGHSAISKTGAAPAIQELEVVRSLSLSERAVALALAISLDNDYFSRRGGWGLPIFIAGE